MVNTSAFEAEVPSSSLGTPTAQLVQVRILYGSIEVYMTDG